MVIKIQCACGTKFEFEVEPANGRMPVAVACPSCGLDGTTTANAQIQQKLAAAAAMPRIPSSSPASTPATPGPMRVVAPPAATPTPTPSPPAAVPAARPGPMRIPTPAAAPQPPTPTQPPAPKAAPTASVAVPQPSTQPRLGIRQTASAESHSAPQASPAADLAAPELRMCPKHADQLAVESCYVCSKPICPKCMELFGYVCSVFCRDKAAARGQVIPFYAHQKSVLNKKARRKGKAVVAAVAAVITLLFATWIWFVFAGSKPHVVYSKRSPRSSGTGFVKMIGPEQYLSLTGQDLSLHDWKQDKAIWTASLQIRSAATPATPPAGAADEDDDENLSFGFKVRVLDTKSDVWLMLGSNVVCFDPNNGQRKHEVPIKGYVEKVSVADSAITIVTADYGTSSFQRHNATRIALSGAAVQTQEILFPGQERAGRTNAPNARTASAAQRLRAAIPTPQSTLEDLDEDRSSPAAKLNKDKVIPAGDNVVQLSIRLLEYKTIAHEAIKKNDNNLLESGRLTAARSLEATEELLNEMKRGQSGSVVQEDVSRYQITLRRTFAQDAPEWSGEVIGPASFFPLKTVDLLVSGKTLHVFDKKNKKLWESPLTYGVSDWFTSDYSDDGDVPALETADTLYFFDQGVLTAFDPRTGTARWRVTSVGISGVQLDAKGGLYVNTSTASPEDIQYSQQIKIFERQQPVLMKVEAATGKVLWKARNVGDTCFLTDKFVYTARQANSMFGGPGQARLDRINPRTGKSIWTFFSSGIPSHMDFHKNHMVLQIGNETQVLKYLTF